MGTGKSNEVAKNGVVGWQHVNKKKKESPFFGELGLDSWDVSHRQTASSLFFRLSVPMKSRPISSRSLQPIQTEIGTDLNRNNQALGCLPTSDGSGHKSIEEIEE